MVAAKNPARDLRGANLMAGTRGKWAGRGGVYLPHNLPIVEAVVSDHDNLWGASVIYRLGCLGSEDVRMIKQGEGWGGRARVDSREDGNDCNVSWIEDQHEDDSHKVVHHPIDLVPFTFSHQRPEITLPDFCKGGVG